jgi:hypothetical protein
MYQANPIGLLCYVLQTENNPRTTTKTNPKQPQNNPQNHPQTTPEPQNKPKTNPKQPQNNLVINKFSNTAQLPLTIPVTHIIVPHHPLLPPSIA